MITFRCCLFRALLLPLALATAGCSFFADDPDRPSPFHAPPSPPPEVKQEIHSGFTVPVELPGQPNATRVFADVGTFAQGRGFVRQGAPSATTIDPTSQHPVPTVPERYLFGQIKLDLSYDPAHLRVSAYLHSAGSGRDRQKIREFYRGFVQEYAGRYGDQSAIIENDDTDEAGVPPKMSSSGNHGGGGSR